MAGAIETGGAADTPYGSDQRDPDRDTASGPASEADAQLASSRKASTSAANSAWCWNRNPCAESG